MCVALPGRVIEIAGRETGYRLMYKLAVRYDANGEIHLMISFRHGFHGFHGKRIKKICVFCVICT